ncbi:23S rRNA (pseudouridine(1915)-N(3))-methyltransferase RlmH [Granulicella arctica]|uniref:23S rRNA (pseudouridine(1915)-N(3))-methyltransferase RlmH n=1 Tax=Granulicella arctica TaxID=940613 RepID=UPI0021DFD118|nr:23S rRNA (pseudouridine(1915)-N(3))-methyltransferase RlmH [Granulicella arctica]
MKISLTAILPRRSRTKTEPTDRLLTDYQERCGRYLPTESVVYDTEAAFLDSLDKQPGRTAATVILLDSRGQQLSSEEFATRLGSFRDSGTQRVILAVGPADGWSSEARTRASLLLSFGRITLPHQLARVIAAEQLYRALTILAGHPYHSGH